MKTIVDHSVTSAPWRPYRWSPAELFSGGALGAWYDFSDTSTLFQDVAATIPVSADGDPVAVALDLSGNGKQAVQSALSARPTWRTDGTLSWIEFDGVDDHLLIPAIAYTAPFTACLGQQRFTNSAYAAFRSPPSLPPYKYSGLSIAGDASTALLSTGGAVRIDAVPYTGSRDQLYNTLQAPHVGTATDNDPADLTAGGTFFCYGQYRPSGKVFGYAEIEGASLGDVIRLERWMATKTGVTL